jgi:energy-coupling factor transport system permease protein
MNRPPRHPLAWLAWLALAFALALTTRNPLYLTLVYLTSLVVYQASARGTTQRQAWGTFIRVGVTFGVLGVAFDTLTAHIGDTVLFRLPAAWPIIGGRITLEAVAHGLTGVLQLACLLVAGAAFNLSLDTAQLLRYVPAAFYHAGLVMAIGLQFIPQTVAGFQEIRDAQRIRGYQFRAARDLFPLIGPLLTTGLERTLELAESLEARGMGYTDSDPAPRWQAQAGLLLSGLGLGGALFGLGYWGRQPYLLALGGAGAVLLVWTLRRLAPNTQRTRYRLTPWTHADAIVALASLLGIVLLAGVMTWRPVDLFYTPYPKLDWPPFEVWLAGLYLLLLSPLLSDHPKQG